MTFSVSSEQRIAYKNAGQAGNSVPINIPGNISEKLYIKPLRDIYHYNAWIDESHPLNKGKINDKC